MNRSLLFVFLATAMNSYAQIPEYIPTDGLVAWYPFNGNVNDESGNGNDGVSDGAALTADRDGNLNSAYAFDGSALLTGRVRGYHGCLFQPRAINNVLDPPN